MPIKQVFESAPGVYRTGLRSGLPDAWSTDPVDRERLYDEYVWWLQGVTVIENLESPTDYEIVAFVVNRERSAGLLEGANTVVMRWSGLTGEFLGHDSRYSASSLLGYDDITTGAKGRMWARRVPPAGLPDQKTYKFDSYEYDFNEVHPAGYYDGSAYLVGVPCIDEEADIALMINADSNHTEREIAVHRESTGEFLWKFPINGVAEHLFMTEDRRVYVVTVGGQLSLVDYTTGQVLGLLDVGKTIYERVWTWDRIAKRILCLEMTPDTFPNGDCTLKVRGYYPTPLAHRMAGPIPLQPPTQGRRVEWLTKVYGAAGEGVPGVVINYSVDEPEGVTIAPAAHTTNVYGNSRTFVTCSLAGDNTLTATAEV